MKISVLTATYNRGDYLQNLYNSLCRNISNQFEIEWLIMDDGSEDDTEERIREYIETNKKGLTIKYFKQENQGKMKAINNLTEFVTGELVVDCDSDDYFTEKAFINIYNIYMKDKQCIENEKIYGLCFLKNDQNNNNMGKEFKNKKTTMFDLYFKEGETGEKSIVFITEIRKKYNHELEKDERFITEARMYHKIDEEYKLYCYNEVIMKCQYQDDGYTKNIKKEFLENPYGYYEYFKEILSRNTRGINLKKRIYVIKHYILFKQLTNSREGVINIKNLFDKIIYTILFIPGVMKSKLYILNEVEKG